MATRFRTAVLLLLAIALFAWFLRDANIAQVWAQIRRADVALLVAGFVCIALTFVLRTFRWQCLLDPIGPTRFWTAFRATVIGFAALALLPARAGDVLRPYLLARQEGLSATSTLATILMERVLDLIAVLLLLAAFMWGLGGTSVMPRDLVRPVEISAAMAGLAAVTLMAVMWTLASHPERIGRIVFAMARVLPHRFAHRLSNLARTFSEGLAVAREPRALAVAMLWSIPIWIAIAAEAWCVTRAFGIAMPFAGSFLVQSFLVIGIAVPTPGGVGGFHEAYRIAVTAFFHAPNDAAVGAAIVLHAVSFVPVALLGGVFIVRDGLSLGRLQGLASAAREEGSPATP